MGVQTFLLKEVIDNLIDSNTSLVSPLIKLNYFGRLIKNEPLTEYTSYELNGYQNSGIGVPPYRTTIGRLLVDVQVYMDNFIKEIPISMLEEPFNEALQYLQVRENVKSLESMALNIDGTDNGVKGFGREVPMEMLRYIQPVVKKLYGANNRLVSVGARIIGNPNVIHQILINVRSKLLAFTMEIGETFGYDIEIDSFKKNQEINNQTIVHYMNNEIRNVGDGNVINTGHQATVNASIKITKGDIKALKSKLEEQGIEADDIEEITEIVQTEQPDFENNILGEKSRRWVLKVIDKSMSGIGKVAVGISSNLLAAIIKQHYGMHG